MGLAWGLALRSWMAVLALGFGDWPVFTVRGTFAAVVAPAVVMGAVLGWAEHARRTGGKGWRWAALAPLLLVLPPAVLLPGFIETLLDTGEGSGAIGVALVGVAGGYAVSGRGPRWARALAGVAPVAVSGAMLWFLFVDGMDPDPARRWFGAALLGVLLVLLVAACSLPHRRPPPP